MQLIDNNTAFSLLLLHAGSDGRDRLLYGDSLERVKRIVPDFLGDGSFPDIYLEFPLYGEPFIDISLTVVPDDMEESLHIDSPLAVDTDRMLAYIRDVNRKYPEVIGGFELDTGLSDPDMAGVFFQPRSHPELAAGFCEAIDEPLYGKLYDEMVRRLNDSWRPSYFGLFRGRQGLPLRIGGYLAHNEILSCIEDPDRIVGIFNAAGFTAYDDQMINQIISVMSVTPTQAEFQFDIFPDGTIGDVFSISTQFAVKQPHVILSSFKDGDGARYIDLLKSWNIADDRYEKAIEAVFAKSLPMGGMLLNLYTFPQWFKVSWKKGKLKPAKMYMFTKIDEVNAEAK